MGIDFRSKFDELFGSDEVQMSSPTLSDVSPGLVQGTGARFASKELNRKRSAVSGRSFRSAVTRSQNSEIAENSPMSDSFYNAAPLISANTIGNVLSPSNQAIMQAGGGGPGGPGGSSIGGFQGSEGIGGADSGNGALGTAMGNQAALSMGISGLGAAALGTAGALGMGAGIGQAAGFGLNSGIQGAMGISSGPLGIASLANSIGGTIASGVIGSDAAQSLGMDPTGTGAAAAQGAVSSNFGLLGMGVSAAANALGLSDSGSLAAQGVHGAMNSDEGQSMGMVSNADTVNFGTAFGGTSPAATSGPTGNNLGASTADNAQAGLAAISADVQGNYGTMDSFSDSIAALGDTAFGISVSDPGSMAGQAAANAAAPDTGNFGGQGNAGAIGQGPGAVGAAGSGQSAGSLGMGNPGSYGGSSGPVGDGGGGGGGGGCVVGTEMAAQSMWRRRDLAETERWCQNALHDTVLGESMRRGYRWYGRKSVKLMRQSKAFAKMAGWLFKKFSDDRTGKQPSIIGKIIYGAFGAVAGIIGIFSRRS